MTVSKTIFVCQNCGAQSPKWIGRCPECGEWNTMVETVLGKEEKGKGREKRLVKPLKLADITKRKSTRIKTKIGEFDRVLGGGIVPGSVVLLAGEPGIGKSTLLTQVIAQLGGLYISGEESPQQIKIRTKRLKVKEDKFFILPETNVEVVGQIIENTAAWLTKKSRTTKHSELSLPMVIVDSIQTMTTDDLTGVAGSIGQVRECSHKLLRIAKKTNIPIFIIGHITKSRAIAGPKVLEHLVDVVLSLEGDKNHQFRILRAYKNRFGPTDEVGVFEMRNLGMIAVNNPSRLFLSQRVKNVPGSVVVPVLAGLRPVLVEVQALVVASNLAAPRRVANGLSSSRLQLLCAVLQKRCRLPLGRYDVYLNIVGGLKVNEPAIDLGVCLAIVSSFKNKLINQRTVFIGEVGLLGEIRAVDQMEKRIKEAKKLGFAKTITPQDYHSVSQVIEQVIE